MKLKRILKLVMITLPIIPVVFVSSLNYSNNDVNDFINKNNFDDLFQMYYQKLGVNKNERKTSNNIDLNSNFNKVGIIELADQKFDNNLYSTKNNFHINYVGNLTSTTNEDNLRHVSAVASIIGTDLGINPNANIFYAKSPYGKEEKLKLLSTLKDKGVNIVNMSIGYPYRYYKWSDLNEKRRDLLTDEKLKKILDLVTLNNMITEINNNPHLYEDLTNWKTVIDSFTKTHNMIFVISSGNSWDEHMRFVKIADRIKNNIDEYKQIYVNYFGNSNEKSNILSSLEKIKAKKTTKDNSELTIIDSEIAKKLWEKDNANIRKGIDSLVDFFRNLFNIPASENAIYVGAVDYNNRPTNFTQFDNLQSINPLVSAYGESYWKDDVFIGKKLNPEAKREYKIEKLKKIIISNPNVQKNPIINQLLYTLDFNGTSMSAPMITGLLSLFQTQVKKELTINEAKILLVSSATYGNTHTRKFNTDSINGSTTEEWWKKNHSKSKTGYGIPKYFVMKNIWENKKNFKNINLNTSNKKLSDWMTADNKFHIQMYLPLSPNESINWIKVTATFKNLYFSDFQRYFYNNLNKFHIEKSDLEIFRLLFEKCKNSDDLDKNNFLDIYSTLSKKTNSGSSIRLKTSDSKYSTVEKTIHGHYDWFNASFDVRLVLKQLMFVYDCLVDIKKEHWYLFGNDLYSQNQKFDSVWNIISSIYKSFMDSQQDIYLNYEIIQ
ncbi:S8 family serine peptidase [Mycoplasma hafezii]|uniref:S8 family serine peptidase n=1 Tax=Mycoplasma hafezii TaxID=525886 RepID=UPI003CF73B49